MTTAILTCSAIDTPIISDKVSAKYKPIYTRDVVQVFTDEGFNIRKVSTNKGNKPSGKHLVMLEHPTLGDVGDGKLNIILRSSHDGSSSFQVMLGVFRFACANGLIVGTNYSTFRIKHLGDASLKLSKAIDWTLEGFDKLSEDIVKLKTTPIRSNDVFHFAKQSLKTTREHNVHFPSLTVKRPEDNTSDAWAIFNRVQEYAIKGGYHYYPDANSQDLRRARAIRGVDSTVRINQQLWEIINEYV